MLGNVIAFDVHAGRGEIRADGGVRYSFQRSDALSADDRLMGARVDFVAIGDTASQIVMLRAGDPVTTPDAATDGPVWSRARATPASSFLGYAILAVTERYADFNGRARPKEYWAFIVLSWFPILIPWFIALLLRDISPTAAFIANGVATIGVLALLVPHFAVAVRRLHDSGRSAWALLIMFLPYVGSLLLLLLMCLPSQKGINQWGAPPLR